MKNNINSNSNRKPLPPTYFFLCLCLGLVTHFLLPVTRLISSPYIYLGILPILFGAWINIQADAIFKKHQTTVKPGEEPSTLVQEGPFKLSRNPMYVGMVAILLGEAIILGTVTPFLSPIVFWGIMHFIFIPLEESAVQQAFGDAFDQYRNKVRRWL